MFKLDQNDQIKFVSLRSGSGHRVLVSTLYLKYRRVILFF